MSENAAAKTMPKLQELEVTGVKEELEENVRGYLQKFISMPFSSRDLDSAHSDVTSALEAFGYYFSHIKLTLNDDQDTLFVQIELGQRLHWDTIDIDISSQDIDSAFVGDLIASLPLRQGNAVRHDDYQQSKAALESALLERGYFDFTWVKRRLIINKTIRQASVVLFLNAGRRYQFGELVIPEKVKAQNYIRQLAPFKKGAYYQAQQLLDFNVSLGETGYFSSVRVSPLLKQRSDQMVPIQIDANEKPANSYELGGGYSTDLGPRIRAKWSKPWISHKGHFFESNLALSEQLQDVSASYTIPVNDPIHDSWRLIGGYQYQNEINEGIVTKTWNVQVQRQTLTTDKWIRTLHLKRMHEMTMQELAGKSLAPFRTEMLIPGMSYAKKRALGGTTPYWGVEHLLAFEIASDEVISSTSLLKFSWHNAWLRSFGSKHLFIGRLNVGGILTKEIQAVPFNMRFFAGGDQSIRGFSYQSIAPKDVNGSLLGGKYMMTTTVEYNYHIFPNWRIAAFIDSGIVSNDMPLKKWSVGAGIGLRYLTPIGPIRVDHAWGVSKESKSTRLSIVIGPEI